MTTDPDTIPPIPAELAIDDEPFTLEELEAALAYLRAHDPECDDPSALLQDLGASEAAVDLDSLPEDQRAGAAAVARIAGWRITDRGGAEWAGRRYAQRRADIDDIKARAKAWKARITEWERDEVAKLAGSAEHLERLLIDYADERRREDPKHAKSTTLPSVTIAGRAQNVGGKVALADEDEVIAWAETSLATEEYEEVIKTTTTVYLDPLRKRLRIVTPEATDDDPHPDPIVVDEGGQPVPGVRVDPEYVSWSVKVV